LRKLKFRLKREYLENIYFTFIRPILEYSSEVWDNCGQVNSDRLEKLQLEAARIVTRLTCWGREAWTDERTAVCHNKPVFWRAYKNERPISRNYKYIIFGQIIFQNFHQFKAFVGLSDCRTIGLSDYSYGPSMLAV
jgi:hypothetical protein